MHDRFSASRSFLANKSGGGRYRFARLLSAFIEAEDAPESVVLR